MQYSVVVSKPAGNNKIQGETSITLAPSEISTPQLVMGSWIPSPKNDKTDSVKMTPGTVTVVIYTTVTVPGVILTESVLSFLGLGIQEPMTSWGVLISDGARVMEVSPWILLFPAGLLSITLYCINFIGDGLRDA